MHKVVFSNGVDSFVKTQQSIQAINGVMKAKRIKRVFDEFRNSLPVLTRVEARETSRQYRKNVTEFIKHSFDTFSSMTPLVLYAWLGLYKAVNAIAENGFVHRELSWNNVRFFGPQQDSPPSVTITDFDLAGIIKGSSSGSPDNGTIGLEGFIIGCHGNLDIAASGQRL